MSMRLLVVGANGALGRSTARRALEQGFAVDVVVNARRDQVPAAVGRIAHDRELESLPPDAYDAVAVAAGFIPYGAMDQPDARLAESNVGLPLRVCRQFPAARIVLASSISVYGDGQGTLDETSAFARPSSCGLSKLGGEAVVRQRPSHAVIRFSSLYGSGMTADTFLPRIVAAARAGGPIAIFGDGSRLQDYLHLEDAAALMLAAAPAGENIRLGSN